ncbi:MAG: T9SS type A sorting domain-containing protein [Bacteroidota bacterium]
MTAVLGISAPAQIYTAAFQIQSANTDRGMRVTTDNAGNVITTGYFGGSADFDPGVASALLTPTGLSEDVYIAKYDAALNYLWAVKYGASGSDFSYALATDASGNIIVGGDISSNSRDGFVNKYDAAGNLMWSIVIGGVNKDVVYGVKTDAVNSVYVTGYFSNTVDFDPSPSTFNLTSNGGRDIFLAKYDAAGTLVWAFNVGGPISTAYEEGGQDIAINGANVYLAGNFEGTADFDPSVGSNTLTSNGSLDIFVAKYDTSGNYAWAFNVGSANKHDYCYGIDIDASENVYITGGFEETADFDPSVSTATLTSASVNAQDIYVAKYNSSGAYQWAFQAGGNTGVDDHAFDIDVTPAGDVYIGGEVWGPADFDPSPGVTNINTSNDQVFFAKYTSAGSFVWVFEVGSTSGNGSADNGFGVHVANSGTLYVTGDFSGTADFDPSAATASLTSSGGDAFVAAYGTAIFTHVNNTGLENAALTVFPNPAAREATIRTDASLDNATLTLCNALGQEVKTMENISGQAITLYRDNLPAGLYYIRLTQDGKLIVAGKLIITD